MLVVPGLFCAGYTIGPGAVTKLAAAGAQGGASPLWLLVAGGLLSWALLEACGRYTVATGVTALHGFRTHLRGGRWLALLVLVGIVLGQGSGLPVLVGVVARLIHSGWAPTQSPAGEMAVAAVMLGGVYTLLATGRFSVLMLLVAGSAALMAVGFLGALWIVGPAPEMLARGLVPSLPAAEDGLRPVVAVLGIALAAPTFLVRSLVVKHASWNAANAKDQRRDAAFSALVMLVIAGSVLACAAGALDPKSLPVRDVFEAARGLDQVAGRRAAEFFRLGAIGAGLSSIIPMIVVLPLLIADFLGEGVQLHGLRFFVLTALACGIGWLGTLPGALLVSVHRTASLVAQVFMLPAVVAGIFLLVNRGVLMGGQRAGFWLNAGLSLVFAFSLATSWLAVTGLWARLA
ncbi:MAG: divalent metal cation transporter [Devosia sp.]